MCICKLNLSHLFFAFFLFLSLDTDLNDEMWSWLWKARFGQGVPQSRHFCSFPHFAFNFSHQLSYFTHVSPALCCPNLPKYGEISARSNIRRSPRFFIRIIGMHPICLCITGSRTDPSLPDASFNLLGRLCRNVDR